MLTRMPPAIRLAGIGWYVAIAIVGGIVGGLLLDGWLDTGKLFTVLGLFAGLVIALWGGCKLLRQVTSQPAYEQEDDV